VANQQVAQTTSVLAATKIPVLRAKYFPQSSSGVAPLEASFAGFLSPGFDVSLLRDLENQRG